jgi:beta-xylosidase
MIKKAFLVLALLCCHFAAVFSQGKPQTLKHDIPLDSIRLSDPFILADKKTATYYMTGTGGMLWKSPDLKKWTGPFSITQTDPASWMGKNPMIWAAELHYYKDKYYYFATFTNRDVKIDTVGENVIERRASHVLVSDKAEGPYVPMQDPTYLPADKPTLDGTFYVENGKPYMVYCYEWLQNLDGTIEKIELKPDLSGSIGEGKLLFRASESPWSREKSKDGKVVPNKVTDGPWLFRTGTGKLGMMWTSWIYDVYTQGVAYSKSGTLDGPWIQEKEPITPPNFGHGMLFQTLEGKWLMSVHSHKSVNGRTMRYPRLFEVDFSGDKLVIGKTYVP